MRLVLAVMMVAAMPAAAQDNRPAPPTAATPASGTPATSVTSDGKASATCERCGVVRSVKEIETRRPPTEEERKSPSGYAATIPLGSAGGKTSSGSVTDVRRENKPPVLRYEIVVLLDDGRLQVVTQDDAGTLRTGDKVRIDRGQVILR
jgi:hypothetical protein